MTYAANRATADRLIEAKGQAVTLTSRTAGAYNVATGAAAVTETTQDCKGVVLPLPRGLMNVGGSSITAADRQLLLSALDASGDAITAPKVGDSVTVGGTEYTITEIADLNPGGTVVLFDCVIRGAA